MVGCQLEEPREVRDGSLVILRAGASLASPQVARGQLRLPLQGPVEVLDPASRVPEVGPAAAAVEVDPRLLGTELEGAGVVRQRRAFVPEHGVGQPALDVHLVQPGIDLDRTTVGLDRGLVLASASRQISQRDVSRGVERVERDGSEQVRPRPLAVVLGAAGQGPLNVVRRSQPQRLDPLQLALCAARAPGRRRQERTAEKDQRRPRDRPQSPASPRPQRGGAYLAGEIPLELLRQVRRGRVAIRRLLLQATEHDRVQRRVNPWLAPGRRVGDTILGGDRDLDQ